MILDKWEERRHIEDIRSLLKGTIFGFVIAIIVGLAIGHNVQGSITIGTFIVLFIADKYFSSIRELERKYKKVMVENAYLMKPDDVLNTDSVFKMQRYNEIKKLGITILNDTEFSKDGYYKTIAFVFMTIPTFTIYNFYKLIMHQIPGYMYGIMMVVLAAIFIGFILDIKAIAKAKNDIKNFIIKEGWDKEWGK